MKGATDVNAGGVGVGDRQRLARLPCFEAGVAIACGHNLLHHRFWNVAPHRVRRLAHSLKRDIDPAATDRKADSPMSMTSPMTTLTRGQYAPLLHRSSAAPHSTLPQRSHPVFLRRDLRHRADYFANPPFNVDAPHIAPRSRIDSTSFDSAQPATMNTLWMRTGRMLRMLFFKWLESQGASGHIHQAGKHGQVQRCGTHVFLIYRRATRVSNMASDQHSAAVVLSIYSRPN